MIPCRYEFKSPKIQQFITKGLKLIKLTLCNSSAGGGEQEYKIVDDYNAVGSDEKPNLIFGKSESVMDDEGRTNYYLYF